MVASVQRRPWRTRNPSEHGVTNQSGKGKNYNGDGKRDLTVAARCGRLVAARTGTTEEWRGSEPAVTEEEDGVVSWGLIVRGLGVEEEAGVVAVLCVQLSLLVRVHGASPLTSPEDWGRVQRRKERGRSRRDPDLG